MKTPEEIQKLKDSWGFDPIWDIEYTEGFEEHYEELKKYREEQESIWDKKNTERLLKKAEKMGIPDNLVLVKHILNIEYKIDSLEKEIDIIKNGQLL